MLLSSSKSTPGEGSMSWKSTGFLSLVVTARAVDFTVHVCPPAPSPERTPHLMGRRLNDSSQYNKPGFPENDF